MKTMDLFTNIHKAAEIINKNKNTHIYIVGGEEAGLDDIVPPVGVSLAEWQQCIEASINAVHISADDLNTDFICGFLLEDLRAKPEDGPIYEEAMKRIIKAIWSQYTYNRDLEAVFNSPGATVGSGSQTIQGGGTYLNTGSWTLGGTTLQSGFSNLVVSGGLEVSGEINADDIKVNGGQLSVSSELDAMKKKNEALEAELDLLKAMLKSKGVLD